VYGEGSVTQTTVDPAAVSEWLDEALEFCAQKSGKAGVEQALRSLADGDCCACEYLRHALVKRVGQYLGFMDGAVRAVYTYEPEHAIGWDGPVPEGGDSSPGMHLVAHVSHKGSSLPGLVLALEAALAEERRKLNCSRSTAPCFGLDLGVADDADVQQRLGYGALITSPWVQPVQVWHR
jgi:hypothetical protein